MSDKSSDRGRMARTAKCQCGNFQVVVSGEPTAVNICHCQDCQRRSGVLWTSNAYFRKSCVRLAGPHKIYTRVILLEGRALRNHFCPECGATVCWTADVRPDLCGIAVGAFNDPTFPAPSVSIWEQSSYAWVPLPPGLQHFPRGMSAAARDAFFATSPKSPEQ